MQLKDQTQSKFQEHDKIQGTDITLIVSSPNGNIITVAQITPGLHGNFETEIKIGGSMWKEDGMYTITANQGTASEYKESINVEIQEGVVVPEFGVSCIISVGNINTCNYCIINKIKT